jgi:hypothetical protein
MQAAHNSPLAIARGAQLATMTILDCASERDVSQERARSVAEAVKPPRLNFAGRCIYCMERNCKSPTCVTLYERSRWAVCPECDGREGDEASSLDCRWCIFGVVEVAPVGVGASVERW